MDGFVNYDRWLATNPYEDAEGKQREYDEYWDYMADSLYEEKRENEILGE